MPAFAAPSTWGYEQVTPADSAATSVLGVGASPDFGTVFARTRLVPLAGMPSDGRAVMYTYGLPRGGRPWTLGSVDVDNGSQIATYLYDVSTDGSRAAYFGTAALRLVGPDGLNEPVNGTFNANVVQGSETLNAVAFQQSGAPNAVYLGTPGNAPTMVSVDDEGDPMTTTALGGGSSLQETLSAGAVSADGSSVMFTSEDPITGDGDGARRDVFRRIVTPGAEQTIAISDANDSGDPDADADADYRWATADHERVFFVTAEGLEPGDTDGETDLYVRDGEGAPVRVSRGETVDGAPSGNGSNLSSMHPEWLLSSQDGERTYFTTGERLTQDAPATGLKLYERDLAEGRTRLVTAGLTDEDYTSLTRNGNYALSMRPTRVTGDGVVFAARAPLAGSPDDGTSKLFTWTRVGGLTWVSGPEASAPASAAKDVSFVPLNVSETNMFEFNPVFGGRGVSDDGSRIFFTTAQALIAADGDDHLDVYSWTANEGVTLVTPPGRAPYDATYLDSSPDGTQVYFNSTESILPGDTDPNVTDVYLAIRGGGEAPGKPGPDADPTVCTGEACQGPVPGPLPLPGIGSIGLVGSGNVPEESEPAKPSLSIGTVQTVTGTKVTLRVKVSTRGGIRVSGSGLTRTSKSATKAATYRVAVTLSARARQTLRRKHRVRVRATVRLTPPRGSAVVKRVSVTFKQPKAKAGKATSARATGKGGR